MRDDEVKIVILCGTRRVAQWEDVSYPLGVAREVGGADGVRVAREVGGAYSVGPMGERWFPPRGVAREVARVIPSHTKRVKFG